MATAPMISKYILPRSASACRITKNMMVPIMGPSTRPMPPMTVMKITNAVQSFTLKAVSGEIRNFCRKMSAPIMAVGRSP
jgi:hypothetical protein